MERDGGNEGGKGGMGGDEEKCIEEGMGWRKGHDERVGEKERGSEIGRERRE